MEKYKLNYIYYGLILFIFKIFVLKSRIIEQRHDICADLLLQGTLYGGQPICLHGPVTYGMLALFKLVFGSYAVYFLDIFTIATLIIIIILIRKIVPISEMLLFILALPLIFIPAVNHIGTFYATATAFIAFYLLFYSSIRHASIVAGLFLGLSLFSKGYGFLMALVLIAVHLYLKNFDRFRIKTSINEILKQALIICAPILAIFLLFRMFFSNIVSYYFMVFLPIFNYKSHTTNELIARASGLVLFGGGYIIPFLLVVVMLIVVLINYLKQSKECYVYIFFLAMALTFTGRITTPNSIITIQDLTILFPFLILNIGLLVSKLNPSWRNNVFLILLLTAIMFIPLRLENDTHFYQASNKFSQLNSILEGALNDLTLDGHILNFGRIFKNTEYGFANSSFDYYPIYFVDVAAAFLLNLSSPEVISKEWLEADVNDYYPVWVNDNDVRRVVNNSIEKKYDFIIMGPDPAKDQPLLYNFLMKNREGYNCMTPLLSLAHNCEECKRLIFVLYKDEKTCIKNRESTIQYYAKNFRRICDLDNFVADDLKDMLVFYDKKYTNLDCRSGNYLLRELNPERITMKDYMLAAVIFVVVALNFITLKHK